MDKKGLRKMKRALVGYTGFVGSNLNREGAFDAVYNSKNITEAYGTQPDILYFAGLRAEKFLANQYPQKDKALIEEAIENIQKIAPKKLVLISTIDVYKNPVDVDEDTVIETEGLHPYGYNRYLLEQWVQQNMEDYLIVRLPGLFGQNIKKNFIYDFIHVIPAMLKEDKILSLQEKASAMGADLLQYYQKQENGFYRYIPQKEEQEKELRELFGRLGFSAVQFTDSRGVFQFYFLSDLYGHIATALDNRLKLLNIATEPVSVAEIYDRLTSKKFVNEIAANPPYYCYQTKYASLFGGQNGYLEDKETILKKITDFVKSEQNKM